MSALHTGPMLGASLRRWMPAFVAVSTPPAEVGPALVSPPSLTALTAQVGVPIGYLGGVYSAGDAITVLPLFAIDGVGIPDEIGPTYTPVPGDAGRHLTITETATTGFGEDVVAVSRSVQVQAAAATAVPSAPTDVGAVPQAAGQVLVTWVLPESAADGTPLGGLTSLTLYHGSTAGQQQPGGTGTTAIALAANSTSRLVTGLPAGARYFAISATNGVGEGWTSYEVTAIAT